MTQVAIRAQFQYPDGTAARGEVAFDPQVRLRNSTSGVWWLSTQTFTLDSSGYLDGPTGALVQALDDVGMEPGGYYVVTLRIGDAPPTEGWLFVFGADAGAGIELAARLQFVDPPTPPVGYVLLSVFLAHVADVGAVGHTSHLAPDGTTIVAVNGVLSAVGGTGDKHYVHAQGAPATVWTIPHNLNKHPAITVVDSAGTQVQAQVDYPSLNVAVVTTSAAFSGTAYCN